MDQTDDKFKVVDYFHLCEIKKPPPVSPLNKKKTVKSMKSLKSGASILAEKKSPYL